MGEVTSSTQTLKDGRTVTIRSANTDDAAALLRFAKDMLVGNDFAGREADELTYTAEEEAVLIEQHRQSAGKLWLVAEHRGSIVGAITFATGHLRRMAHCGTFGMGIDREWRGQGLGSALLGRLLDWAEKEPSVEKVALAVFASNEPALRLYKNFGFIEEGRRVGEFKLGAQHYVDDILMYRWVKV